MAKKRIMLVFVAIAMAFGLACSRSEVDQTAQDFESATEEAATASREAADEAASDVAAAAEDAENAANDAGEAVEGAAASRSGDPVATCRELAEREAWGEALTVCEKAHELLPDDLQIEHALQQARAAAE